MARQTHSRHPFVPRTLDIIVTQDDIEDGTRNDITSCPIALAAWRQAQALGIRIDGEPVRDVRVSSTVRFYAGRAYTSTNAQYRLSKAAARFIQRFDNRQEVKPVRFRLPLEFVATH